MPAQARNISRFTNREVQTSFKKAILRYTQNGLQCIVAPAQRDAGRILVITSRKSGNAPSRNRIRRQLKNLFYIQKLYEKPYDLLIIVKKEGIRKNSDELRELLKMVYEQVKKH
jgi:ribonuclease P protein component